MILYSLILAISLLLLSGLESADVGLPDEIREALNGSAQSEGDLVKVMESLRKHRRIMERKVKIQFRGEEQESVKKLVQDSLKLGTRGLYTQEISVANRKLDSVLYQGDVMLTPDDAEELLNDRTTNVNGERLKPQSRRSRRGAMSGDERLWDANKPIYYEISEELSENAVDAIRRGMQFWSDETCISFEENATATPRLRFLIAGGCWSFIGRMTWRDTQDVSIGRGCEFPGITSHEIAHALGFYHTQARWDRDDFVAINFPNIKRDHIGNFVKMSRYRNDNKGIPYDYGSVMQYNPFSYAVNPRIPVVMSRDWKFQAALGNREQPVFSDMKMMNILYNCNGNCSQSVKCQNFGYPDPKNCTSCKCPQYFEGSRCENVKVGNDAECNATDLVATSTWQYLQGKVGNENDKWSNTWRNCFWRIRAPPGKRVLISILRVPNKNCWSGCGYQHMEVNPGHFETIGMLLCCRSVEGQMVKSINESMTIKLTTKYSDAEFSLYFLATK